MQDVHHAVPLEHPLPKVGGWVTVRVGGVALAAILSGAVGALVEGQKIGILSGQPGGHPNLGVIHAEEGQDALVKLEAGLPRVPVIHPLALGVFYILTGVLVF